MCEVQDPSGVGVQPGIHRGVLVHGVVVAHHVQWHAGVSGGDLRQKPQELLMPMPRITGIRDDLPGRGLWRCEEGRGVVPLVVAARVSVTVGGCLLPYVGTTLPRVCGHESTPPRVLFMKRV